MSNAKLEVLTPHNSQFIIIDHQPQMAFGVQSMDRQTMKNNVVGRRRRRSSTCRPPSPRSRANPSRAIPIRNCSMSSPASRRWSVPR